VRHQQVVGPLVVELRDAGIEVVQQVVMVVPGMEQQAMGGPQVVAGRSELGRTVSVLVLFARRSPAAQTKL
jgi:hypothetical protein